MAKLQFLNVFMILMSMHYVDGQAPGPPGMFQITSVTATSLSFSWRAPTVTNGVLTGYQLTCQPELPAGIPSPPFLTPGPTVNTAMLPNLSPGVRYNCCIVASNSAGSSDPVYALGTTTETAPNGPPQSFTVTERTARNMTFSWSPPVPTLRNGMITGYSLSCVPETGGGNTIFMQYTAAGTFTLGGLIPATSYNCSISASNSQGSGPATYLINTTLEAPPDGPPQNFRFLLLDDVPEIVDFFWEPPPLDQQNGIITGYNIICTPTGDGQPVENFVVTDDGMSGTLNATVGIFTPATQYSCAISASTSAGPGPAETRDLITLPASPENVTLNTTSSPLRVTWTIDPPDGVVSHYTIYVTRLERGNTVVNYTSTSTQLLQFDVPNLDPYELVEVSVSARNSAGEGPRSPGVRGRTREESPGIVSNCPSRWTDLASAIQVTWTAPERPNGVLLRYHLQLTSYDGRRVITFESVGSSTLLDDLDNSELQDGVPYIVSIFAENSAGNGTKCNVTDFTNELAPPAPSNVMATHINATTLRVSWQPMSLVEARGHITYRVMVTPTTGSRRRRQATQGERVCTLSSPCKVPANESSVIVGGLVQDKSYSVTVMAVNSEGEAGPTSVPITATIPNVPILAGSNTGTVVGVAVALVVAIIIMGVVIGVLVARNRRYKLSVWQRAMKDEPVKWSEVAGSGDTNIITTQCEAYATVNQGHEYEVPEHTAQQPPGPEYDIPVTKCPAYVPTSEQEGGRVEEAVYESV